MPAHKKKAVKVFLQPSSHAILHRNKALRGVSISDAVDDLVQDVLREEVEEIEKKGT